VPKIHFHSDCEFFSGSENMLANLFSHRVLREEFDVSFSYRATTRYEAGLRQRVELDFPCRSLALPNFDELPLPHGLAGWRPLSMLVRSLAYAPLLAIEVKRLRAVLREFRPDLVHINNGGYPGALSCRAMALAARAEGVSRVLMVVNNLAVPYDRPSRWLDWPFDRRVAACVDRFVTGSAVAGRRLAEVLKLPQERCRAIHNGIRMREPRALVEKTRQRLGLSGFGGLVLGMVALHEPRKGHRVLLEAIERLHAQDRGASKIKVLIEGDGPLHAELAADIVARQLSASVQLIGVEAHVFDFMAAIDALVLPSVRDEDFPNVIIEAMSLGKPVIASCLAGIPEQIEDGVSGLLVPAGDAAQLAAAIHKLAAEPEMRQVMGESARVRFHQHFSCEIAMGNYLRLYRELLNLN
jgi:glycosyltransferase involved in cell wall biosynthesis